MVVELYLVILLCGSLITSLLLPLLLAIVFSSLYMILLAAFSEHEHVVTAVPLEWELFFQTRGLDSVFRCQDVNLNKTPTPWRNVHERRIKFSALSDLLIPLQRASVAYWEEKLCLFLSFFLLHSCVFSLSHKGFF